MGKGFHSSLRILKEGIIPFTMSIALFVKTLIMHLQTQDPLIIKMPK